MTTLNEPRACEKNKNNILDIQNESDYFRVYILMGKTCHFSQFLDLKALYNWQNVTFLHPAKVVTRCHPETILLFMNERQS